MQEQSPLDTPLNQGAFIIRTVYTTPIEASLLVLGAGSFLVGGTLGVVGTRLRDPISTIFLILPFFVLDSRLVDHLV